MSLPRDGEHQPRRDSFENPRDDRPRDRHGANGNPPGSVIRGRPSYGDERDDPQQRGAAAGGGASLSQSQVNEMLRNALALQGIGPTTLGGLSDRMQRIELAYERDVGNLRIECDRQHETIVRLTKTGVSSNNLAAEEIRLIRELLGCKEGESTVDAVRRATRWQGGPGVLDPLPQIPEMIPASADGKAVPTRRRFFGRGGSS